MKSGAALAVTGVTATLPISALAKGDDSELLARVATFWKAHEKNARAYDAFTARQNEIEAMPDYPPEPDPQLVHEDYDAFIKRRNEQFDFRNRHGRGEMYDAWAQTGKRMGEVVNAVFACPAQTVRGAYEKLRITRLATGIGEGSGTGDGDLCCYQDYDAPWIDSALADLEWLAGGAA